MIRTILPFVFALFAVLATAQEPRDGVVRGDTEAWDAESEEWTPIEVFWVRYADRRGGLTWGRGPDYPPYAEVEEFDTFLVELDSGPCLMEFFHGRWRRANDVRRWDDGHNEHGGCPSVFD